MENSQNKEKWWLVKWSGNWADEIDFVGQSLMDDEHANAFKDYLQKNSDKKFYLAFGSNQFDEDITYGDYLNGCEFIKIEDRNIRDFLFQHLNDNCWWSPANVFEDREEDQND